MFLYIQNAPRRNFFEIALFTTHTARQDARVMDTGCAWANIGLIATRLRAVHGLEKERGPFGPPSLTNIAFGTHAYSASVFTIFGRPRFTSMPLARFNSSAAKRC